MRLGGNKSQWIRQGSIWKLVLQLCHGTHPSNYDIHKHESFKLTGSTSVCSRCSFSAPGTRIVEKQQKGRHGSITHMVNTRGWSSHFSNVVHAPELYLVAAPHLPCTQTCINEAGARPSKGSREPITRVSTHMQHTYTAV